MILGIRAHDFGKLPLEEMAVKVSDKGFKSIQLALAKALEDVDSGLGKLSPGMANYIRDSFYKKNINISVLGCYVNLIHPDRAERTLLLERFKEHIRFAKDFGCSIVGSETGSVNQDYSFNTENHGEEAFQTLVETLRELIAEAEKYGVFVCIEAVKSHVINSPQRMKRMLDTINSSNLQVIFDPVNLLTIENYLNQRDIIDESLELFGDKILVIHAKDFILDGQKIKAVPAGTGLLDYEYLFEKVKKRKPYISVLIEDNKPEFMDKSIEYLNSIYQRV